MAKINGLKASDIRRRCSEVLTEDRTPKYNNFIKIIFALNHTKDTAKLFSELTVTVHSPLEYYYMMKD
jgi:hypothetical protein